MLLHRIHEVLMNIIVLNSVEKLEGLENTFVIREVDEAPTFV